MVSVTVLTLPSSTSCRKSIDWLRNNGIDYVEKKLSKQPLEWEDFLKVMTLSDNGVESIITKKSMAYKALELDIDDLTLSQAYSFIRDNPKILRSPIIFSDKKLIVGFNDDVHSLMPRSVKEKYFNDSLEEVRLNQKDVSEMETPERGGMYETYYFVEKKNGAKAKKKKIEMAV